jgi:hypothetical protein
MHRTEAAWRAGLRQSTIAGIAALVARQAPPAAVEKTTRWLAALDPREPTR